ncbi:MAG: hypothetical protein R3E83_08485 [Burkholderiaceae bacterium]
MRKAFLNLVVTLMGAAGMHTAMAEEAISFSLATERVGPALRPVTATPLDPTSPAAESLFGGQHFSAGRVALDIVINGWRAQVDDEPRLGRNLFDAQKPRSRWRLRASTRSLMLRYEIVF